MIKVNLLAKKRRKPIQIPFAAIFFFMGLAGIGAGFYVGTLQLDGYNDDLIARKETLRREIHNEQSKLDTKDLLESQRNRIRGRIDRLKQLSGTTLFQWSDVFSDLTSVVPQDTVWLTHLRIDRDRRVNITAYSSHPKGEEAPKSAQLTRGIQDFIEALQKHRHFHEVFLTNATKNIYEKQPVWRFDINCRITRDVGR